MKIEKNRCTNFLSCMEGYHQQLKMLHWATTNKAEHLLTDEIDGDILEFEDAIAENLMGSLDIRFGNGDLKTLLPNNNSLSSLLDELKKDVNDFRKECDDDGVINVIDDFLSKINKWKYLKTLS